MKTITLRLENLYENFLIFIVGGDSKCQDLALEFYVTRNGFPDPDM